MQLGNHTGPGACPNLRGLSRGSEARGAWASTPRWPDFAKRAVTVDHAPDGAELTDYDEEHAVTYVRMLDADAEGANWREVARIVLHIDPDTEGDRAHRAFDNHLSRAKWISNKGYRQLLRRSVSR